MWTLAEQVGDAACARCVSRSRGSAWPRGFPHLLGLDGGANGRYVTDVQPCARCQPA